MIRLVFFNSLYVNDTYNYKKLGFIKLICKYTRNNCFLTLKNKFGTIVCFSCGFIEKSITKKKRAYSTYTALITKLVDLCKKKSIFHINQIIIYRSFCFRFPSIQSRISPLSYSFYKNKIHVGSFKIITLMPHHFGKKKRKIRRK